MYLLFLYEIKPIKPHAFLHKIVVFYFCEKKTTSHVCIKTGMISVADFWTAHRCHRCFIFILVYA